MSQKEIRPAANGTDTQPITTSTISERWKLCTQHGGTGDRRSACKVCQAQYKHQWYEKNRDRILAHQRQYRAANLGIVWANHHRERARRYGYTLITDLITPEDVTRRWGDRCFHCKTGAFEEIDHLIPVRAGGHHQLGNVVPCCRACNIKKRWGTDVLWIRRFHEGRARKAENGLSDAASRT